MSWGVLLLLGAAGVAAATFLAGRRTWARNTARLLEAASMEFEKQLVLARAGSPLATEFGTAKDAETIRFLYDKRLTLFNTRREHEWKIYFGAMALLGAVDAALVTGQLTLSGWSRYGWVGACALVFIVVFGYERDLQIRNTRDRVAMDQLFNRLCDLVGVASESPIREHAHLVAADKAAAWWSRYGWAFPWQMILLFTAAAGSACFPFVV